MLCKNINSHNPSLICSHCKHNSHVKKITNIQVEGSIYKPYKGNRKYPQGWQVKLTNSIITPDMAPSKFALAVFVPDDRRATTKQR